MEAAGDPVSPGVLSALGLSSSKDEVDAFAVTNETNGRRLELAQWIAHPKNQLTAVQLLTVSGKDIFGKPLAGNPNNFGAKGKKPTHPHSTG